LEKNFELIYYLLEIICALLNLATFKYKEEFVSLLQSQDCDLFALRFQRDVGLGKMLMSSEQALIFSLSITTQNCRFDCHSIAGR
jgi:hypothetical protein